MNSDLVLPAITGYVFCATFDVWDGDTPMPHGLSVEMVLGSGFKVLKSDQLSLVSKQFR